MATGVTQTDSMLTCVGLPSEVAKAAISKYCSVLHTGFLLACTLLFAYFCNCVFPGRREEMNNIATWPPTLAIAKATSARGLVLATYHTEHTVGSLKGNHVPTVLGGGRPSPPVLCSLP